MKFVYFWVAIYTRRSYATVFKFVDDFDKIWVTYSAWNERTAQILYAERVILVG